MKTWLLYAFLVAGQTADSATTCRALRLPGAVESNRLLPGSCRGIAITKAATVAAYAGLGFALRHAGHPKLSAFVVIVPGGVGFAAAVVNIRTIRRQHAS